MQRGIYLFPEFSPGALAAFSNREFEASRDQSRFLESLGALPERSCGIQQVHGDYVAVASKPFEGVKADGMVTRERNLPLLIRTADCVPVFFFDSKAAAVGICHAGWRGAKKGIVARVLEIFKKEFGSDPASILVAIGPAIRQMCYEVGEEFDDYFPGWVKREGNKRFLDLVGVIKKQLVDGGVRKERVIDSNLCTVCSVDQFFSARSEGFKTGRFLSAIMLK